MTASPYSEAGPVAESSAVCVGVVGPIGPVGRVDVVWEPATIAPTAITVTDAAAASARVLRRRRSLDCRMAVGEGRPVGSA